MGECFWVDADAELVEYLTGALGETSGYGTLQVRKVISVAFRDQADWEKWALDQDLPAVIVQGRLLTSAANEHLGVRLGKTYPYIAGAIVEGTLEEAHRDAKILARRIEQALQAKRIIVSVPDDGEIAHDLIPTDAAVTVSRKRSSHDDSWFGWGVVGFRIRTSG